METNAKAGLPDGSGSVVKNQTQELRSEARRLIEEIPEEKIIYLIQIIEGLKGFFGDDGGTVR